MLERKYKFSKAERLCKKKIINQLFNREDTSVIKSYPLLFIWKELELDVPHPAQILISVPKKFCKKAVTRNRLKRQIREVYRHQKHVLYRSLENRKKQAAFLIVYYSRELVDFNTINKSFEKIVESYISSC